MSRTTLHLSLIGLVCTLGAAACADSNADAGGAGGQAGTTSPASVVSSSAQSGSGQTGSVSASGSGASASASGSGSSATTAASTSASSSSTGLPMVDGYEPEVEPNDNFMTMGNALTAGSLGFVGASGNSNDSDVFTFQGVAGESRHIAISDGMGGCPVAGTSLQVQLFSPTNQEIASRFDTCPVLDTDLDVANLPVTGTYKIRVTALAPVPFYVLEIGVIPVECGNAVRQSGESCDDGNLIDGDGCDATCQVELPGGACAEVEPNDLVGDATSILGCAWGVGTSASEADLDHYSFDVPADGYSVRIEVHDVTGTGCPGLLYGGLRLFNQANAQIASVDTFSNGDCPQINPAAVAGATNLVTGKYKVAFDPGFGIPGGTPYAISVNISPPGCGDSIVQVGEECDDGNLIDGDFCDATCQFPPNVCGEVEPNNAVGQATPVGACIINVAPISPIGDQDFYSFQVTVPGSKVRIQTTKPDGTNCTGGYDTVIHLYDPAGNDVGNDDDGSTGACSLIDPAFDLWAQNLAVGTWTVSVEEFSNDSTIGAYGIVVEVIEPGCGDNILQPGEECDDGNQVAGDGCSDTCIVEGVFCDEVEPNNTQANATPLTNMCRGRGGITPVGDVDRYSFVVPAANTTAVIEVSNGLNQCPSFDSFLRLYDPAGVQLATDDDSGVDICSRLTRAGLAAGTYTFEVSETGNNATQASYVVAVTLN